MKGNEMPVGLTMALAMDRAAMRAFAALPEAERAAFVERTRQVESKNEMRRLVAGLAGGEGGVLG